MLLARPASAPSTAAVSDARGCAGAARPPALISQCGTPPPPLIPVRPTPSELRRSRSDGARQDTRRALRRAERSLCVAGALSAAARAQVNARIIANRDIHSNTAFVLHRAAIETSRGVPAAVPSNPGRCAAGGAGTARPPPCDAPLPDREPVVAAPPAAAPCTCSATARCTGLVERVRAALPSKARAGRALLRAKAPLTRRYTDAVVVPIQLPGGGGCSGSLLGQDSLLFAGTTLSLMLRRRARCVPVPLFFGGPATSDVRERATGPQRLFLASHATALAVEAARGDCVRVHVVGHTFRGGQVMSLGRSKSSHASPRAVAEQLVRDLHAVQPRSRVIIVFHACETAGNTLPWEPVSAAIRTSSFIGQFWEAWRELDGSGAAVVGFVGRYCAMANGAGVTAIVGGTPVSVAKAMVAINRDGRVVSAADVGVDFS